MRSDAGSQLTVCALNLVRGLFGVRVLPHPHDTDPEALEPLSGVEIARLGPPDLLPPELDTGLRLHVVIRTTVPEAPVHEDIETDAGERQVRPSAAIEREGLIDPEPEPTGVEDRSERQLRTGVPAPVGPHGPPRRFTTSGSEDSRICRHPSLGSRPRSVEVSRGPSKCNYHAHRRSETWLFVGATSMSRRQPLG